MKTLAYLQSDRHSGASGLEQSSVIINADDWGRDHETTDRAFECFRCRSLSSVSAMVFMEDSERAAVLAKEHGIDAGLHLNLTTPFLSTSVFPKLADFHERVASYLNQNGLARVLYHPGLRSAFEYVVKAQVDEYCRIYGKEPDRIDGHHHAHLCSNVLFDGLLPRGVCVRRYFSFETGQDIRNRVFRRLTDKLLVHRYRVADYFFSLPPVSPPERLQRIFSLANRHIVELETHPVNPVEYRFLTGSEITRWTQSCPIARSYMDSLPDDK